MKKKSHGGRRDGAGRKRELAGTTRTRVTSFLTAKHVGIVEVILDQNPGCSKSAAIRIALEVWDSQRQRKGDVWYCGQCDKEMPGDSDGFARYSVAFCSMECADQFGFHQ